MFPPAIMIVASATIANRYTMRLHVWLQCFCCCFFAWLSIISIYSWLHIMTIACHTIFLFIFVFFCINACIVCCNAEHMVVNVQNLSLLLVVALELDLLSYRARCTANLVRETGSQIPRTRLGWLTAHFKDTASSRNNGISQAISKFNRTRGVPVDTVVFKNQNEYH